MMRVIASACVILAAGLVCSRATSQPEPAAIELAQPMRPIDSLDQPLPLLVPYRGLMTGLTGWAAYGLLKINASDAPLTDSDWSAAGMAGVNLTAIATLLSMPGSGANDKRRYDDPEWRGLAADLQNAGVFVASAALKHDRDALRKSVSALGKACQACHDRFMKPLPPASPDMAR